MRILVIEDEHNYVVDVLRDGVDGRHAALKGNYDLVILDVMLPGIDGFGVLADLRRVHEF